MRRIALICVEAAVVAVGFAGASFGQVQSGSGFARQGNSFSFYMWAHASSTDYGGKVSWSSTVPFVPYWYGYGPSDPTPTPSYSFGGAGNPNRIGVAPNDTLPNPPIRRPSMLKPLPRIASPQLLGKIDKLIADGDEQFARQKYAVAAEHYRAAIQKGSADAHFRQGFALVALGNYKGAVTAFRNGLTLKQDWTNSPFQLDQIYAPGALDKMNARLARKLTDNPLEPNLLASLGMQLYFSGDREKSALYVSQAAQLGAIDATLVDSFLPKEAAADPPPAKP